jgi:hypothetical protein
VLDLPFLYIARYWVAGKVAMVKQNDYKLSSNNYQLLCLSCRQKTKQLQQVFFLKWEFEFVSSKKVTWTTRFSTFEKNSRTSIENSWKEGLGLKLGWVSPSSVIVLLSEEGK